MLRIALTPGEPAGVGPELVAMLAQRGHAAALVAVCDPRLLHDAAARLALPLRVSPFDPTAPAAPQRAGEVACLAVPLRAPAVAGRLDPRNAAYVVETLERAGRGCLDGTFQALVTGPVHKGVINDGGIPFSGHTELFALQAHAEVVMMLCAPRLRVALATTHLPLAGVPAAITRELVERCLRIVERDLRLRFRIATPRIAVLGLNPHAGEGGHLGREEIEVIAPVAELLRAEGMALAGPLAADTAFAPARLDGVDAYLAMYHDQGLPVLKALGFGDSVNATLGLPYVRTSVDHGVALDVAGTGRADAGSLEAALAMAMALA